MSREHGLSFLPHVPRLIVMIRLLRDGQPMTLVRLADELRCSEAQIRRYLHVLASQGCLIDQLGEWIRMVDDHTSVRDDELERMAAGLLARRGRARSRRNAA